MMSLKIKFLACFPKVSELDDEIRLVRQAHETVKSKLSLDCDIKSSRDWFNESFPTAHDYSSWIHDTVNGRDYLTREPNFRGFVVFSDRIGKMTAEIVNSALESKKVVLLLKEGKLFSVARVQVVAATDWHRGWSVLAQPIGSE